ncbi:MAG: hypothetical protein JST80_04070 [Bdellovibrionales bacterium]|nr:hypothetical protein [Bdellovibrionales bacterium]
MSAARLVVRTRKEDSALLYHILEAHEGLTAYSTLFEQTHALYRDVELIFVEENRRDVMALLEDLGPMVALSRE